MRFLSAIPLSSILSLTAMAAPSSGVGAGGTGLTHPPRGDIEISREVHIQRAQHDDASALAARMGPDLFEELDLTAREANVEAEFNERALPNESIWKRPPGSGVQEPQAEMSIAITVVRLVLGRRSGEAVAKYKFTEARLESIAEGVGSSRKRQGSADGDRCFAPSSSRRSSAQSRAASKCAPFLTWSLSGHVCASIVSRRTAVRPLARSLARWYFAPALKMLRWRRLPLQMSQAQLRSLLVYSHRNDLECAWCAKSKRATTMHLLHGSIILLSMAAVESSVGTRLARIALMRDKTNAAVVAERAPQPEIAYQHKVGLPLLKPKSRRSGSMAARQAQASSSVPVDQRCNVFAKDIDGNDFGYFSPSWTNYGAYSQLNFKALNGPGESWAAFGAISGDRSGGWPDLYSNSASYLCLGGTFQQPAGTPVFTPPAEGLPNSYNGVMNPNAYESAVWDYAPSKGAITVQWINTDGSKPATHVVRVVQTDSFDYYLDALVLRGSPQRYLQSNYDGGTSTKLRCREKAGFAENALSTQAPCRSLPARFIGVEQYFEELFDGIFDRDPGQGWHNGPNATELFTPPSPDLQSTFNLSN
ncbi:hypothetical protein FB451DRAFT_1373202, partial [Mycena latifolia]